MPTASKSNTRVKDSTHLSVEIILMTELVMCFRILRLKWNSKMKV